MSRERMFSEDDMARVRDAVAAAERKTSGEIVPYVVEAADDYPEAAWRGAALGALVAALLVAVAHFIGGFWGGAYFLWTALPALVGATLGFLAVGLVAPLRRALVHHETRERRVELRAAAAFVEQEVFATRERTGILLFVSLFERRVLVMADAGIHRKVEAGAWEKVAQDLAAGIRAGRAGDSLVTAVGRCGEILQGHGVERREDDVDELPDELHFEKR